VNLPTEERVKFTLAVVGCGDAAAQRRQLDDYHRRGSTSPHLVQLLEELDGMASPPSAPTFSVVELIGLFHMFSSDGIA
jgi:hypothetical protein